MRFLSIFSMLLSILPALPLSVGATVVSDPDLNAAYSSFNAASASTKVQLAQLMLQKTSYGGPLVSQQDEPKIVYVPDIIGFAAHKNIIQSESFINQVNVRKVVHACGVAATVSYQVISGTAPSNLFPSSSSVGVIRVSSGTSAAVLGIGIAVFGDGVGPNNDGNVQTRVFSTEPTSGITQFNVNVPQQTTGVSAEGPEGRLWFQPSPWLYDVKIGTIGDITEELFTEGTTFAGFPDFRRQLQALKQQPQQVIGYIVPAPDYPSNKPFFNVSITLTSALYSSQAADQNWHFRRTLTPFNLAGDALLKVFDFVVWLNGAGGFFQSTLNQVINDICNTAFGGICGVISKAQTNGVTVQDTTIPAACPYAQQANMMNQATIAAIVVASVATLIAITTSVVLIKQRNKPATTPMPLELKA